MMSLALPPVLNPAFATFKVCPCCGLSLTLSGWNTRELVGFQYVPADDFGPAEIVEMRNCECGSTIGVVLPEEITTRAERVRGLLRLQRRKQDRAANALRAGDRLLAARLSKEALDHGVDAVLVAKGKKFD